MKEGEGLAQSQAKMRVTGILLRVSDDDPKLIRKAQVRRERRRVSVWSDSKRFNLQAGTTRNNRFHNLTAVSPCRFSQPLLSSTALLILRDRRNREIYMTTLNMHSHLACHEPWTPGRCGRGYARNCPRPPGVMSSSDSSPSSLPVAPTSLNSP